MNSKLVALLRSCIAKRKDPSPAGVDFLAVSNGYNSSRLLKSSVNHIYHIHQCHHFLSSPNPSIGNVSAAMTTPAQITDHLKKTTQSVQSLQEQANIIDLANGRLSVVNIGP